MRRTLLPIEVITDPDHLRRAFMAASRGKRQRPDQRAFAADLDRNLDLMRLGILDGSVAVGQHRRFVIHDPKERTIHAPVFAERVLHHAVMAIAGPAIERSLIADTFACVTGRGQFAALDRAQDHARHEDWFLKVDIRRYFYSIPHDAVIAQVRRRFAGPAALALLERIIRSHEDAPGVGLPIGTLISQHFANLHLDPVDRLVTGTLRLRYMRYMDDMVVWGGSRQILSEALGRMTATITGLGLCWKPEPFINRTCHGLAILGWRVFPDSRRLDHRGGQRLNASLKAVEAAVAAGDLNEEAAQRKTAALFAWAAHGDTHGLRRSLAAHAMDI